MHNALNRVSYELNEGILSHLQAKRMHHLEKHAVEACFAKNDFTFQQAERCQKFLIDQDYKLNLIKSFTADHLVRHINAHESCYTNDVFASLKKNEDKDRVFVECHNHWIKNLNENVSQELEVKAR